ncbi:hypothetical protein [Billgrantia tianxiuensis]|uniref:hypothetical protein n=1 Tax=Billgrantia tianxiuensis TaxID=2497861 RepID=UPI001F27BFA9|nr:hypothetical protein [Halomonas tianxiuensis]
MLTVTLASAGFIAGGHVGSEAMPDIDGDVLEARILMPQGTPLARTEAVAERVEAAMRDLDARYSPEQPEGASLVEAIQVRFNHNLSAREAGPHVATVSVDLLTAERRSVTLDTLTEAWREAIGKIEGLQRLIIQEPGFGPAGVPVEVRLAGENLEAMKAAALELGAISRATRPSTTSWMTCVWARPSWPSPWPRVPTAWGFPPRRWPANCARRCWVRLPIPSASATRRSKC